MTIPCRMSPGEALEYEVSGLTDATTYVFEAGAIDRFGNESGYVGGEGRTIDHINRPPAIQKPLPGVELPDAAGEEPFVTAVELSDYFTDPDLPADELSYAARSNDESVATVSVSGSMLTVEGLKLGATYVSVTVTDLAGESIVKNMSVKVLEERFPEDPPTPIPPEEGMELTEGALTLFPNPAPDALFIGVGVGLGVRMGGASGGDDALAMSIEKLTGIGIQWVYLVEDLIVLTLSLSYIPLRRIAYSLLTVILSGQLIGLVAKKKPAEPEAGAEPAEEL